MAAAVSGNIEQVSHRAPFLHPLMYYYNVQYLIGDPVGGELDTIMLIEGKNMKRLLALFVLLVMIVSLSACGAKNITMQDVYDAGQLDALLREHNSVKIQHHMEGELFAENYLSREYVYDGSGDWAMFLTDSAYFSYENGTYRRVLLISPDGLTDIANYRAENYASPVLGIDTLDETIKSVTKKGDRTTVKSFLDWETIEAMGLEQEGISSYSSEYVLDTKTNALISATVVIVYGDEAEVKVVAECTYDPEDNELIKTFLKYDTQTEDMRTVTVVSNPGTESEKTESVLVPKGMVTVLSVDPYSDESYALYADAACTQPYSTSGEYDCDATIYVKWGE